MPFPGSIYAPPGVYTRTLFENPIQGVLAGVRIPIFIGTGNEILQQQDLEVIRGSSSSVDQQVPQEDETGRAVVDITATGEVVLGDFNGDRRRLQVRNFPIVSGDGSGTVATDPSTVLVTINGRPDVVLSVARADIGVIEISTAPELGDDVRVTYFFNRTDTQTTDNVSEQTSTGAAIIDGAIGNAYEFTSETNTFSFRVDDDQNQEITVTFPTGAVTAATVVSLINGAAAATSLVSSTFENNFGDTAVRLSAARDIRILGGTANAVLGFTEGTDTNRNKTFYVFNGPIVDGTNGGITTTDTSKVTVRIDGQQVIPSSVDGQTRAVTLPFAPEDGATLTIQYYFNTWQDTFDYLANIGITDVLRCGIVPGNNDFVQGADYVLKDDKIVWGTSFLIGPGITTPGAPEFGESQISGLLVDNRWFLAPTSPVVDTTVNPPLETRKDFSLPVQPTTGNGRNNPLGQQAFLSISNNRVDLATNNPNLVTAYWGFGAQDAIQRGPVEVTAVSGTTITLKDPVPVGAEVWATFYYNILVDETYTLEVETSGPSGIGTYFIFDSNGNPLYTPKFGVKGPALTGVTIQFPSGSELTPDVHFEGGQKGPVEETITVTFADKDATIAKFTVNGSGPYEFVSGASDRARFLIDSSPLAGGAVGIDLSAPNGEQGLGFLASLLGEEISYTDDSGKTTYDILQGLNDDFSAQVDDVVISVTVPAQTGVNADAYVEAINAQAKLAANKPFYTASSRFLGATVITAGEYDTFVLNYTGVTAGASGPVQISIPAGTYTSPNAFAAAVDSATGTAIGALPAAFDGLDVEVTANANGQLQFALCAATGDLGTFATGTVTNTTGGIIGDTIDIDGVTLVGALTQSSGSLTWDTGQARATVVATGVQPSDTIDIDGGSGVIQLTALGAQTPGGLNFDEGDQATGTITLNGALPILGTVVPAADTVTVDGVTLTAVEGGPGALEFDAGTRSTGNCTLAAVQYGDQVIINPTIFGGSSVTLTAANTQGPGNLDYNVGTASQGSVTVSGVQVGDVLNISGNPLTAVDNPVPAVDQFYCGTRSEGSITIDAYAAGNPLVGTKIGDQVAIAGVTLTAVDNPVPGVLEFYAGTRATTTITVNAGVATASITIDGGGVFGGAYLLTDNGTPNNAGTTYGGNTGDPNTVATNIRDLINDGSIFGGALAGNVTASVAGNVVTLELDQPGTGPAGVFNTVTCVMGDATLTSAGTFGSVIAGAGDENTTATSLDAAINLAANGLNGTVTSTVALNVCTVQAVTPGTAGDSINLVTTGTDITIAAMGTVTAGVGDDQFVSDNLTTAINAPANSFDTIVSADNGSGTLTTVTLTAVTPGAVGNSITLTVTPPAAAARLTVATMGTVTLGVGDDISAASSLVAAINDSGNGLASYVFADNGGGTLAVVTVTAIQPGSDGNFVGTTENEVPPDTGRLTWAAATLLGGLGNDDTAATSLQAAIAANVGSVTAVDVLNAVNLTAVTPGNVGNLITLASTDASRIALSGATLDGGLGTDITVASSIVAAINDLGNGLSVDVMADNDGGTSSTVTVWALVPGIAGNANTIASSDGTRLPVSAWGGGLTSVNSATNIVTAINDAGNGLNGIVTADNTSGASATVDISAAVPGPLGNNITLASSDAGRLPVSAATLTGGVGLGGGYLEFLDAPTLAGDFAILAGISTDALPGQEQTKLIAGDIVRRFAVAGTSGRLIYDRLILRSRLVPGSGSVYSASQVALTQLVVAGTNAADYTGLQSGAIGLAGSEATVQAATLFGEVGFKDNQVPSGTYGDERDGMPQVTFYSEGGTQPQNNVFKVNIDGIPFTTEFTDASGAGIPVGGNADVPLGPITIANTVLEQIQRAAVVQGLSPNVIQIEGAGIRFVSQLTDTNSAVTIDSANANDTLGFSDGAASTRALVQPETAASALMSHAAAAVSDIYLDYANPDSTYFAAQALAGVERDSSNAEFLFIESQANNFVGLGTASNITLDNATADSWLLPGTGLNNVAGDGASGEAGFQGYYVTSSDLVDGSGTADTSCLNNGAGQDGIIGQSYRDTITGLVFTILPREGGASYPVGPGSYFTFKVTRLTTTDANLPVNSIPGLELLVANTEGSTIPTGDTALVETIEKGGLEPAVGDSYFVTYNYSKTEADFETKLFTSQRVLEREYGPINPDFPLSLTGFLGFTNGAVIVGCKQVPKVPGSNQASVPSYLDALETLRGPLPGGVFLDTITPLRGDSLQLFQALGAHCDVQSSIRFRAERTAIVGVASGTQPDDVGDISNAINNTRMRLVYPDIVFLTIQDALGNNKQFLVDGPYLAAAMAGNRATPSIDVATPWTRARLVSFDQLARTLDAVQQNQVAVQGITVLEDRNPILQVRQGLSTNISNILTKTPTIITIADEVQRQARATLDRFIGIKFLPGVLQDIEGQLAFTLKQLKNAEIIAAYTGVQANTTNDPTTVEVEAFYQPVFPLLYIVVTFNLRSNLGG